MVKIYRFLSFLFLIFLLTLQVQAQQRYDLLKHKIDSLIAIELPKSALEEAEKMKIMADRESNEIQSLHAILYRLNLTAQLEKTLGKNIKYLENEIEKTSFPIKSILQSVLAETYWNHYKRNRHRTFSNNTTGTISMDNRTWELKDFIQKISELYDTSILYRDILQNIPIKEYATVLTGNTPQQLRPTLYDLLAHRALSFYNDHEYELNLFEQGNNAISSYVFESDSSFYKSYNQNYTKNLLPKKSLEIYQNLYSYHLQKKHTDALADLYLNRIINLYKRYIRVPNRDFLFIKALNHIEEKYPSSIATADVLYEKATLFERQQKEIDAHSLYKEIIKRFPNSNAAENAKTLLFKLEKKELSITLEAEQIPNKNTLAKIDFKNVTKAKYTLYKVNKDEANSIIIKINDKSAINRKIALEELQTRKPFRIVDFDLPQLNNFKLNSTEIKVDPLPIGIYFFVLEHAEIKPEEIQVAYTYISSLTYSVRTEDNKQKILVVDRETGAPIKGVSVTVFKHDNNVKEVSSKGKTDENGFLITNRDKSNSYSLSLKKDFLPNHGKTYLRENSQNNYNEKEEHALFTDRKIYRPGQTIYFKGIKYINSSETSNVCEGDEVTVYFASSQLTIEKTKLTTNEFGTYSGNFPIPESLLNGSYYIQAGGRRINFKIEEYKRPSFSIEFSPIKANLTSKDSVIINAKAVSYAGYSLQNAKITYTIHKSLENYSYQKALYLSDSTTTNKQGIFSIRFIPDTSSRINTYTITANVTDFNGETQHKNTSVTIGSPSLRMNASVLNENYITDTLKIPFSLTDLNRNNISGKIKVSIYKAPEQTPNNKRVWFYNHITPSLTKEEYATYFPETGFPEPYIYNHDISKLKPILHKSFIIDTAQTEKTLNITGLNDLESGNYIIYFTGYNHLNDSISSFQRHTKLITSKVSDSASLDNWAFQQNQYVSRGEKAVFYIGLKKPAMVLMEIFDGTTLKRFEWIKTTGKGYEKILVPYNNEALLGVTFSTFLDNRQYTVSKQIKTINKAEELSIQMLSFREKIQPGDRDRWIIKVTDKNGLPVKAELLTAMYDVSLDALNKENQLWKLNTNNLIYWNTPTWIYVSSRGNYSRPITSLTYNYHFIQKTYEKLKYLNYNYSGTLEKISLSKGSDIMLRGNSSYGEGPVNTLNEVNVAGYGTDKNIKGDVTGSVANVTITEGEEGNELFTNVDYSNYEFPLPQDFRNNFNETAFFSPHLITNEKGEAEIEFTSPGSLTTWKFRVFAHTKDLKTAFIEKKVIAQKPLMIFANPPRFFREGDNITLITKTTNLNSREITGKSNIQFFNADNMKALQILATSSQSQRAFNINSFSSDTSRYRITIPNGVERITYRLSAGNSIYYDGEEKTIPVLSNKISITESESIILQPGEERNVSLEDFALTDSSKTLQSVVFKAQTNPLWDVINALPYLQQENRTFQNANSLLNIFTINQMVLYMKKQYRWTNMLASKRADSIANRMQELANTPWFRESSGHQQQKSIYQLFKGNNAYTEQSIALELLMKMQKSNGSFPWFDGCLYEDRYVTQQIIAGLGKIQNISVSTFFDKRKAQIISKCLAYLDHCLIDAKDTISSLDVHGWYARSFHKDSSKLAEFQFQKTKYIDHIAKNWNKYTEYEQGLIAHTFFNLDKKGMALPILKSLKEKALLGVNNTAYWPKEQQFYWWNRAEIEKHALMIELFGRQENEKAFLQQLLNWLRLNKQTTYWKTSNATSAACMALLTNGDYSNSDSKGIKIYSGGKSRRENTLFQYGSYQYIAPVIDNKVDFPIYKIANDSKDIMIASLTQKYKQNLKDVKAHSNSLKISKTYYKRDTKGILKEIQASHKLSIGDKITVRLHINADRNFEYIHLKDERPSGTEPVSLISSYKYLDNLFYYTTTKDTSTDIFINYIPKGSYIIDYDLFCSQAGQFSSGISRIESLYAPEFGSHTTNRKIEINK